jgi:excinuclease ABC subunit C
MIQYNQTLIDPQLTLLPSSAGIYIYLNITGEIIYVGKAINLKKRVTSYFKREDALGPKTQSLVSQIENITFKTVGSEIEALILEAKYIKKYRPKFNSLLKDDKSYIYIVITKDKLPKIYAAFKSQLDDKVDYFGPFPSGGAVKSILRTLRHIFPYLSKKHSKNQCLYCHIGLCPGPNPELKDYRKNISKIKRFLNGGVGKIIKNLNKQMLLASKSQDYEKALHYRQQIDSINYVVSGWHNLNNLFEKTDLPEDDISRAKSELMTTLTPYFSNLKSINRIDTFDISNLGSHYFVGSMVVFDNDKIDHQLYRKFKIYSKDTPDDQFMIREVVFRRLNHPEWGIPSIIMVDGGKPQVNAALQAVKYHDSLSHDFDDLVIIGLAKKFETIVVKHHHEWVEINLPKNSSALRLLQRLRDEAHRFANRYRKELISKKLKS